MSAPKTLLILAVLVSPPRAKLVKAFAPLFLKKGCFLLAFRQRLKN
jgi:hypothetical protein